MARKTNPVEYLVVWKMSDETYKVMEPTGAVERFRVIDNFKADDRREALDEMDRRSKDYANTYGEGTVYLVATGSGRTLKHTPKEDIPAAGA